MDEKYLEMADALTQSERDTGIAAARRVEKAPASFNGVDCVDCEGEIPAGRLALGKFRCVNCQEYKESPWRRQ